MKVRLADVRPNPYRDFSLYPLDEEQLDRLQRSISDDGFFGTVTARPALDGNGYELAAGHHRVEAAKRAGLAEVEITVQPYSDQQMVRIMSRENLTQRGHNAAASLDSVAAQSRLTAFAVLAVETFDDDGGDVCKILQTSGVETQRALETARALVASEGPGRNLIYRAINGFSEAERKANKHAETMTTTEIGDSLKRLKASGVMAQIVVDAQEKATAVVAARREAEEAASRAKEAERQAVAKVKRSTTAEAAKRAEAAAVKKREREKADAAAAERAKAIAAQAEREAVYDIRCDQCFRTPTHAQAFMTVVTSEVGRAFLPRENQFALAQHVRAEVDAVERERSAFLGSSTVRDIVQAKIDQAVRGQRSIDEAERAQVLKDSATARVENHWSSIMRHAAQAEAQLAKIAAELDEWEFDKALFPVRSTDLDKLIRALEGIKLLKAKVFGER